MPVNNQNPNSEKDIRDKITRFSESLSDTSFKGVNDLVSIVNDAQLDSVGLLRKLTEDIDRPLLKTFSTDMINFLGSFYGSEEVLCCLLKNLIIMAGAGDTITEWREAVKKFKENITGEEEDLANEYRVSVSDLAFVKTLDEMIFVIDTIIVFLELDVQDVLFPIIDFSHLLSSAILGMLIIAMQEIVFTLRDTAIAWVIDSLVQNVGDQTWLKCLPFMDFVRILRRYIHDYGFLDRLFTLINGYVGDIYKKFDLYRKSDILENVRLLEFLKWLRDILVKMKNAAINWELCVDLDFDMDPDRNKTEIESVYGDFITDYLTGKITLGDPPDNLNITLGDDNTILSNIDQPLFNKSALENYRPPSNSEIRNFLVGSLGISAEQADQMTGMTNARDNIQGTLSRDPMRTNNDCGYTLNPSDIKKILLDIIKSKGL
jgi:hypothetical protein